MTTFDSVMAQQHPYTSDSSFEDFNGYSSYKPTSPHTGFSPTMGSQEISALLDAFTGTSGEDYSSSLFTQQQPNAYFQSSSNYETFNPAWTMGTDSTPSSFGQSTDSGYSPKSSLLSSDSQRPMGAIDGLRISQSQQNVNSFDASTSMYASTESFPSGHRPTSQTVPYLEAIASAPSSAMSMSYSQSQSEQMPFNPQSSHLARQDSTRSFLEGPHLSSLTLDSPRNSISAGSSAQSSSQNSPTTPLSAYATDLNLSFQGQQQQKYLSQNQTSQQGHPQYQQQQQQQTNFIPYVNGAYQARPNYVAGNALSMSVPASMSRTGYEQPVRSQLQSSARPHGRMSSAGLMDQIVSSRQVLASPVPEQMEHPNPTVPSKEKKGLRSRASSRSSKSKTSPTPPATPGRSGLRHNKHGVDATQLHTILSGHTTPTAASPIGARQAPSSAGPHRTPSKRTLSYENVPQQATTPAATTPRRPSTLRRTASHTPGSTLDNTFDASGLASPANLQASQRAQNAAQFAMASAMAPAQKARIAASANLEFPGGASGGMSRAQSSPGYALSASYSQQQQSVTPQSSVSPSNTNDQAKRRSNTLSSLHMSPMAGAAPRRGSDPAYSPSHTVSFAEALLALDQITSFLNYQSSIMTPFSDQSMDNVLGTYEQLQNIEDLKRRVHNKLAFPS